MRVTVVKIGGQVLDNQDQLGVFIENFLRIAETKVLVHGGGLKASRYAAQLGVESQMIAGRRVTSAEMLDVVSMVYSGLNKQLVSNLALHKCSALGITGADLQLIPAWKRIVRDIDYGFAGDFDIAKINIDALQWMFDAGVVPVICALTYDKSTGSLLNTNADTIAQGIASAMGQAHDCELIYVLGKRGLLLDVDDDDSVIPYINIDDIDHLVAENVIVDGMIPKVHNARKAIHQGISRVRITHFSELASGTVVE